MSIKGQGQFLTFAQGTWDILIKMCLSLKPHGQFKSNFIYQLGIRKPELSMFAYAAYSNSSVTYLTARRKTS